MDSEKNGWERLFPTYYQISIDSCIILLPRSVITSYKKGKNFGVIPFWTRMRLLLPLLLLISLFLVRYIFSRSIKCLHESRTCTYFTLYFSNSFHYRIESKIQGNKDGKVEENNSGSRARRQGESFSIDPFFHGNSLTSKQGRLSYWQSGLYRTWTEWGFPSFFNRPFYCISIHISHRINSLQSTRISQLTIRIHLRSETLDIIKMDQDPGTEDTVSPFPSAILQRNFLSSQHGWLSHWQSGWQLGLWQTPT